MPSSKDAKLPESEQNPSQSSRPWLALRVPTINTRDLVYLAGLCLAAYFVYFVRSTYLDVKNGLLSTLDLGKDITTSVSTSAARITCTVIGVGCDSLPGTLPESAKVLNFPINPEGAIVHLDNEARNVQSILDNAVKLGKWDIKELASLRSKSWRIGNAITYRTDVANRKELGQSIITISKELHSFFSAMINLRRQAFLTVDFFILQFTFLDQTLKPLDGSGGKVWADFDITLAQFHQRLIAQLDEYLEAVTNATQLAQHFLEATEEASPPIEEAASNLCDARNSQSFLYVKIVRPFTMRGRQDDKNIEILHNATRHLESALDLLIETRLLLEESLQFAQNAQAAVKSKPKIGHNHTQSLESWKITILGFQDGRERYLAALRD